MCPGKWRWLTRNAGATIYGTFHHLSSPSTPSFRHPSMMKKTMFTDLFRTTMWKKLVQPLSEILLLLVIFLLGHCWKFPR